MSKGTKIVQFRLPPDLEREVLETIERRNHHSKRTPWDRTGFLLSCIWEKIRKMERSRKRRVAKVVVGPTRRTSTEDL